MRAADGAPVGAVRRETDPIAARTRCATGCWPAGARAAPSAWPPSRSAWRRPGRSGGTCFAGRASAATMRANQLRLWFASMAYVLLCALRRIGLAHTRFAEATCGTLRLGLLKIGALVRVSVRRIKLAMASAHPFQDEFALAHARLTAAGPA